MKTFRNREANPFFLVLVGALFAGLLEELPVFLEVLDDGIESFCDLNLLSIGCFEVDDPDCGGDEVDERAPPIDLVFLIRE